MNPSLNGNTNFLFPPPETIVYSHLIRQYIHPIHFSLNCFMPVMQKQGFHIPTLATTVYS